MDSKKFVLLTGEEIKSAKDVCHEHLTEKLAIKKQINQTHVFPAAVISKSLTPYF